MSRKFHVTIELEMPEDQQEKDAWQWAAALLSTAFDKPNPAPRPPPDRWNPDALRWEARVPMSPSEHPYRPQVVGAKEVEQPRPRSHG